jgi:hypothetical protein
MATPPQVGGMDISSDLSECVQEARSRSDYDYDFVIAWFRFRKHGYKVVDQICDYYARLNELPVVAQVEPGYLVNDLPSKSDPTPQVHILWILDCWLTTFSTCNT